MIFSQPRGRKKEFRPIQFQPPSSPILSSEGAETQLLSAPNLIEDEEGNELDQEEYQAFLEESLSDEESLDSDWEDDLIINLLGVSSDSLGDSAPEQTTNRRRSQSKNRGPHSSSWLDCHNTSHWIKKKAINPKMVGSWDNFEYRESVHGERIGDKVKFRSVTMALWIRHGWSIPGGGLKQSMWDPRRQLLRHFDLQQRVFGQEGIAMRNKCILHYRICAFRAAFPNYNF